MSCVAIAVFLLRKQLCMLSPYGSLWKMEGLRTDEQQGPSHARENSLADEAGTVVCYLRTRLLLCGRRSHDLKELEDCTLDDALFRR